MVDIYTMEAYQSQLIEYRNALLSQEDLKVKTKNAIKNNKNKTTTRKNWIPYKLQTPTGGVMFLLTVQVPYKQEESLKFFLRVEYKSLVALWMKQNCKTVAEVGALLR